MKDEEDEGLTILCSSSLIVFQSFNLAGGQGGSKIDPPALILNFSRGG